MSPLLALTFILISYLFGCLNGAYYVGKILSNQDVRDLGSSNAGARNAGRVFGHSAFIYTVIIDALKTIVPLLAAAYLFDVTEILLYLMALAVLIGHIWPVQLQFSGGKGVVVYLAVALALALSTLLLVGLTLLIGLKINKSFTIVGLIAISTIPIALIFLSKPGLASLFVIMLLIVIVVHRNED